MQKRPFFLNFVGLTGCITQYFLPDLRLIAGLAKYLDQIE